MEKKKNKNSRDGDDVGESVFLFSLKKNNSTVCYVMILLGLSEVLPPVASSSKNIALHKQTQGI